MTPKNILKNIPLFKNLDDEDLELIATRLRRESHPKGTIIFKEGDEGDTIYLVESGQLAVVGQDAREAIAFLGPGSFVGEISLLLAEPRTATLQVTIDAQLWALNKVDFDALINTRPSIAREMLQEIGRRLVTTTRRRRRLIVRRVTALWGDEGLALAQVMFRQLKAPVGVLPLPGARLNGQANDSPGVILLDNQELTEASLAEGLSYQVEVFKHVILLLPDTPGSLAAKAINLADTVVSVGASPDWLTAGAGKKDFWTTSLSTADLYRMARRLTNRTVGLALSSGGTRGLVHVGVLKVFMEEDIPVDLIAGTSGGALFGALYAAGWSYQKILDYIQELKTLTRLENWDLSLPLRGGIVKGRKARDKFLAEPLNFCTFDDLKLPMFIVAADILTGEEVIFNSGVVADAIRASASIPILGQPWHYQNHYFVDGGIVNPLPANVLRNHGADIVIGSSVIQSLAQSFSGPRDKMPTIWQTIFNIFSAMEAEVVKKQLPLIDLLIQHNVSARSTLDFERVDELIASGEHAARQMVPQIKRLIETPPET
ncbi:MAG: patatin-like phospholipase family protein [Anaerolineae bacterium]